MGIPSFVMMSIREYHLMGALCLWTEEGGAMETEKEDESRSLVVQALEFALRSLSGE